MKRPVTFYSEGCKLVGDVYYPDDLQPGETRAGSVLCHGYTDVKDLYLPDNARVLNEASYMVMTFDYKGWGESAGARSRLAPYSRVADVQAAVTFLGTLPEVDTNRLGIYDTSYGGATVVWVGAIDPRVTCIVSSDAISIGILPEISSGLSGCQRTEIFKASKAKRFSYHLLVIRVHKLLPPDRNSLCAT
jgi:fermentation-respiration switch protein FrsA (DUF1100 family)